MEIRRVGDVVIVDCVGNITLKGGGSKCLCNTIRDLASKGEKNVVLNLAETFYVDSSGIGEFVSGFTTLANQGATLKLLALSNRVKDLLQITKLYTVFEVHDNEAAAVRSFH